jgi:hypothetical protein
MELIEEIRASRTVGYRTVDSSDSGWKELGIDKALKEKAYLSRYNFTMEFITESVELDDLRKSEVLDAGEYNPFSKWVYEEFGILVKNTSPNLDFDYCFSDQSYVRQFNFVFAFDIIEHLMNPLMFLEFLARSLSDTGKVFLTTPFARPRFLWSKYHVTEYFPDKIELLARKAGLRINRYKLKKVYALHNAFSGIRPFFRAVWFERIMFFEMVKP